MVYVAFLALLGMFVSIAAAKIIISMIINIIPGNAGKKEQR